MTSPVGLGIPNCFWGWQELSRRTEMMEKMEVSLETYKRKFGVVRHQQGLLYQEYLRDKKVSMLAASCYKPTLINTQAIEIHAVNSAH